MSGGGAVKNEDYGASLKGSGVEGANVVATGASLIAAERERQVMAEGWTPEHDDTHECGELSNAAAAYALYAGKRLPKVSNDGSGGDNGGRGTPVTCWQMSPPWWPKGWEYKPGDRIRDLVRAGALIAAEIDRLQRAAQVREPRRRNPPKDGSGQ